MAAAARSMWPGEVDRAGQDRLEQLLVLHPRRGVLVLDDERHGGDVDVEQLARGELVVQPVHGAVLQVGERVVPGRAGQLVLAQHGLLLPRVGEVRRVARDLLAVPVAALQRLAAVAPGRDAARVDDLSLDVHAGDEEGVPLVLEVLEHRAGVLAHQDRVRRVVVDAELVADAVALGDLVQRDPRRRGVRDVVVEVVAGVQPGIGHCSTR
jgi:hypothetical protein